MKEDISNSGAVSVSHKDYDRKKGDRYQISKPTDSNILQGNGSFVSETQKNADYVDQKGEICKVKRPISSEIWKIDGKFETKSVSRRDFSPKKGERCAIKKPCDTDILFGDGSFRTETHSQVEFTAKKADKFEIVRPGSAGIWKEQDGSMKNEVMKKCRSKGCNLEDRTIYRTSSNMPEVSSNEIRMTPIKLQESMLWQNGQMKMESQYNTDFVPKLKPCPAGELIKSIAKNHSSTEHFEFYRILGGHHFYEPKADNV
ncbi:unnamed protein product [Wuchereria bancrofti]|uniref:Uncharacterized protein n=1 Tax=Wuchereria bancrofti TaxID=6293 RepID=A0A3P7EHK7_WUCBA|nr:unnamed protein product [Wuchereria bancrofti]